MPQIVQTIYPVLMPIITFACLILSGMLGYQLSGELSARWNKWLIFLLSVFSLSPILFVYWFNLHQTPLSDLDRTFGLADIGFCLGMMLYLRDIDAA